jgi:hypothetical protein
MAYVHSLVAPHSYTGERKPGLFRRLLDAMKAARMRDAEREIARYLAANGHRLTDETEREIERRMLDGRW